MKATFDYLFGVVFMHKHDVTDVNGLSGILIFKGNITVDFDSSSISGLTNGWVYSIKTTPIGGTVTDIATGQTFNDGDEIAWNGTDWTILGGAITPNLQDVLDQGSSATIPTKYHVVSSAGFELDATATGQAIIRGAEFQAYINDDAAITAGRDIILTANTGHIQTVSKTHTTLISQSGSNASQFTISPTNIIADGVAGFAGIQYGANFRANFIETSLVDKAYVDSSIADINIPLPQDLQNVLEQGQTAIIPSGNFQIIQGDIAGAFTRLTLSPGQGTLTSQSSGSPTYGPDYGTFTTDGAGVAQMTTKIGAGMRLISMNTGGFMIIDTIGNKGITYASDYSANYVDRSLVDKAYVDSSIGASIPDLQSVLSEGNITNGSNIEISIDDNITFKDTIRNYNIRSGSGNFIIESSDGPTVVSVTTSQIKLYTADGKNSLNLSAAGIQVSDPGTDIIEFYAGNGELGLRNQNGDLTYKSAEGIIRSYQDSYYGEFDFSNISSSNKTLAIPNKSGTIALLSDVINATDSVSECYFRNYSSESSLNIWSDTDALMNDRYGNPTSNNSGYQNDLSLYQGILNLVHDVSSVDYSLKFRPYNSTGNNYVSGDTIDIEFTIHFVKTNYNNRTVVDSITFNTSHILNEDLNNNSIANIVDYVSNCGTVTLPVGLSHCDLIGTSVTISDSEDWKVSGNFFLTIKYNS